MYWDVFLRVDAFRGSRSGHRVKVPVPNILAQRKTSTPGPFTSPRPAQQQLTPVLPLFFLPLPVISIPFLILSRRVFLPPFYLPQLIPAMSASAVLSRASSRGVASCLRSSGIKSAGFLRVYVSISLLLRFYPSFLLANLRGWQILGCSISIVGLSFQDPRCCAKIDILLKIMGITADAYFIVGINLNAFLRSPDTMPQNV